MGNTLSLTSIFCALSNFIGVGEPFFDRLYVCLDRIKKGHVLNKKSALITLLVIVGLYVGGTLVYRLFYKSFTPVIGSEFLIRNLRPVVLEGCQLERTGREHDGGYLNCVPRSNNLAAAFSYGIEGRDSWGCDFANKYQVPVYQFDPFDTRIPKCNQDNPLMNFNPVGIDKSTYTDKNGIKFESFSASLERLGVTGQTIVKMDIEGAEWNSLEKAIEDGSYKKINQLIIEIHDLTTRKYSQASLIKRVLKKLNAKFHIVHLHANNYACDDRIEKIPASVLEVTYVNKNAKGYKINKRATVSPFPIALDTPNNPKIQDCQFDTKVFLSENN
jgi:hypothetical protein